jgi:hypothetical protein
MQESVHSTAVAQSKWSVGWSTVAYHRLWSFLLVGIGAFSSVIYPHPPFVAFGAIAGTTLKPKRAILVAMAIWLMNQIYGYTVRQYPWSADSLLWGLMLGLGTLIITALALLRPPCSQKTLKGHCLWVATVALGGFAVFQSLILTVDWLLTGSHTLTWAIAQGILINTTIWTIALAVLYLVFIRFTTPFHQPIS